MARAKKKSDIERLRKWLGDVKRGKFYAAPELIKERRAILNQLEREQEKKNGTLS